MLRVLLCPLLKGLGQRESMCLLLLAEGVQCVLDEGQWSREELYQRLVVGSKILNDLGTRLRNYSRALEALWQEVAARGLLQ